MTIQERLSEIEKKNLHPFDGAIISRDVPKLVKALRAADDTFKEITNTKQLNEQNNHLADHLKCLASEARTKIEHILNSETKEEVRE